MSGVKDRYVARVPFGMKWAYVVFPSEEERHAWAVDLEAYRVRRAALGRPADYWPHVRGVLGLVIPTGFGEFTARPIRKDARGIAKPEVGSTDRRRPGTHYPTVTDACLGLRQYLLERGDFREDEVFPLPAEVAA